MMQRPKNNKLGENFADVADGRENEWAHKRDQSGLGRAPQELRDRQCRRLARMSAPLVPILTRIIGGMVCPQTRRPVGLARLQYMDALRPREKVGRRLVLLTF